MSTEAAPDELARRLEDLESRIAYQEHWLDALDEAVAGQEQRLTRLERLGELMRRHLRDQRQWLKGIDSGEGGPVPQHETPPHY